MGGAQTSIADDSSVPPADQVPDATFEAVALVTLPFCVVLFIFSLFSRSTDPKRWHMLNLSAWMFWQLVLYSNIAEQSPLRNFLHDESIWLSSEQWLMLNMSVISTGLILLYLESLISAILCVFLVKPRETFRRFYTLVWFILMLIVPNIAQGYCMYLELKMSLKKGQFEPLPTYNVIVAMGATLMGILYFLLILVLSCCLPFICRRRQKEGTLKVGSVIGKLHLVSLYGFILQIILTPYQSMNYGDFLLSYYKGFLYKIVGQIELNPPDQFRMAMINAFLKFISLRDFLILYTPSAVCLLAFVCFPLYPKKVIYLSRRAFVYKKRRNHISPTYNEETPDTSASNPAQKQSIAA